MGTFEGILLVGTFVFCVLAIDYIYNLYCKLQWLRKMKYGDSFLHDDYLCKFIKMVGHNVVFRYYYNDKLNYVYFTKAKKY